MPPKAKVPAPIDRPLSRAYLRGFTGWSTAYPPGHSEPTSLRIMENVMVDRNGSLGIRPGLRYLSYMTSPDIDALVENSPGLAIDRPMVGSMEPFYTVRGERALLFAVREADSTVGFRAMLFTENTTVVHALDHQNIGFWIPQGEPAIRFSTKTTHVEYLQIDNKILAMSDAGEDVRLFFVGAAKTVKRVTSVSVPRWEDSHKLDYGQPDAAWINQQTTTQRRNEIYNSSFEILGAYWTKDWLTGWKLEADGYQDGRYYIKLTSWPTYANLQTSPLHNVASTGTVGWHPDKEWGDPTLLVDGSFMKVNDTKGSDKFFANGARIIDWIWEKEKYKVALDYEASPNVIPLVKITFYNSAGAQVAESITFEMPQAGGRFVSSAVTTPADTISMRLSIGGRNTTKTAGYVKAKNIQFNGWNEPSAMFHGSSGANYFWEGPVNASTSTYHPPTNISITSARVPVHPGVPFAASVYVSQNPGDPVTAYTFRARTYDRDGTLRNNLSFAGSTLVGGTWYRAGVGGTADSAAVLADQYIVFHNVPRGRAVFLEDSMLEVGVSSPGEYFDGSFGASPTASHEWGDRKAPHQTFSVQTIRATPNSVPNAETPTAKTLVATGGAAANPYKMGFFYTFENEMGESAPSKIVEMRMSRPWSNWIWETPNAAGEPSGVATDNANLCADQIMVVVPEFVYDQAVAEGAVRWNLYAFSWSDQEPVPVVAQMVGSRELYVDDGASTRAPSISWIDGGWQVVTPSRKVGINDAILPTRSNRVNYSDPPQATNGLVAGDRVILVGDPNQLATIKWSSNRPGEYTNFTSARGGGAKTLTSGNLNLPIAVALWQNPQSVDTLTILCMGQNGASVSYYMMPAAINAQSGATSVMGFEETTSTPGTTSPYANEVLNNALFRPTDRALLKSNAQNYNITHKTLTDTISNMWLKLQTKEWIMSAQMDNRLIYIVNNPLGEPLEEGCKGNEIWVYDVTSETGFWSRLLIQAAALRVFSLGAREYLGVIRPDGLYYFDNEHFVDDYVGAGRQVLQRPIPWRFETNTQGANRAHDAWAHLQNVQVSLGGFRGTMQYGIRGQDLNHRKIQASKIVTDPGHSSEDGTVWDIDDVLQVRRDMKEWFFFASSVDGKESRGQVGFVQYRYTPVSVNVGYEYGSVETFEYGSNVATGPTAYSDNGIPIPVIDYTRP